jgi:hypothetical protein
VSGVPARPSGVSDRGARKRADSRRRELAARVQKEGSNRSTTQEQHHMPSKTPSLIGAVLALIVFLVLGLLPSLTYGGYAGVLLAKGIFGAPLQGAVLENALIVFGAVLGVVGVASLFLVTGAATGAAVGAVVALGAKEPAEPEAQPRKKAA